MSSYDEQKKQSGLSGLSMAYLDFQYELYLSERFDEIDSSILRFFEEINGDNTTKDLSHAEVIEALRNSKRAPADTMLSVVGNHASLSLFCAHVLQWFERYGHYGANLGLRHYPMRLGVPQQSIEELLKTVPSDLGSCEVPADLPIPIARGTTFSHMITLLKHVFQSSIGYEYDHIEDDDERDWFRAQSFAPVSFSNELRKIFCKKLMCAEELELYLGRQHVGQKRFSLEGSESFLLALDGIIGFSSDHEVESVVLGMAHRGRLNVMVNLLGLPCRDIDGWFKGFKASDDLITGDVKYHLGFSADRSFNERPVHITMNFNPSHLESIVPVTMGVVRARQDDRGCHDSNAVLPILVHGDASVVGQGVVAESLNMAYTQAYDVGGAVHIVINNQIGFTTMPNESRSSYYCTDLFKSQKIPVLHVNGDDPEAVYRVALMAANYRCIFKKDIVVDILSYRKHGHNEADEPSSTSPLLYQDIRSAQCVSKTYADTLVESGVLDAKEVVEMRRGVIDKIKCGDSLVSIDFAGDSKRAMDWKQFESFDWRESVNTCVAKDELARLGQLLCKVPNHFSLQRQVASMMTARLAMYQGEKMLNWGAAESLLFASFLDQGVAVRLVGQDACRGTFSHRHAILYDQETGQSCTPLQSCVTDSERRFSVYNSTLSEFAALGFEYGYSLNSPRTMTLWEAQFGDFVNGAQVIIDQYITSAWQKWGRRSGLVLLLPHGYEGQGPEHSSARLERFLQLGAQNNIQVCVPSTPSQYFHVLRRQMLRSFRSPLVLLTPKSLLRNPHAVSELSHFFSGQFELVFDAPYAVKKADRVVLCSGKVYYDLLSVVQQRGMTGIALCRIEQLYPFPVDELRDLLVKYKQAKHVIWCQEEPKNQGAWYVFKEKIMHCLQSCQTLCYAGRPKMASSAPGDFKQFKVQQDVLVLQALGLVDNPSDNDDVMISE